MTGRMSGATARGGHVRRRAVLVANAPGGGARAKVGLQGGGDVPSHRTQRIGTGMQPEHPLFVIARTVDVQQRASRERVGTIGVRPARLSCDSILRTRLALVLTLLAIISDDAGRPWRKARKVRMWVATAKRVFIVASFQSVSDIVTYLEAIANGLVRPVRNDQQELFMRNFMRTGAAAVLALAMGTSLASAQVVGSVQY